MTDAELFAHYKSTAPIEDLRFSLRLALKRLAVYELPEATVSLTAEMAALEVAIADQKGTPSLKNRVWALISRYRASIPGWCGAAGAKDGWVDYDVDSADAYRATQAELIEAEETLAGPVSFDFVRACFDRLTKRSAEINGIKVPRRAVELTPEEVEALMPVADALVAIDWPDCRRIRKPKPAPVVPSSDTLCEHCTCDECKRRREMPKRAKAARKPRPPVVPIKIDGERKCRHCEATQPLQQFAWGAGHTLRNTCLSCRKAMQRAAMAARKAQAA
jgi:hypothetical protein